MKYIISFPSFNESKGISDSCEFFLNKIWDDIELDVTSYTSNVKIFNIDISDFKANNISIRYNINNDKNVFCHAIINLKDSYIENQILNNSSILLNISTDEMNDEFIFYIKSTLLHELIHLFQHYNILLNKKFRPESFSIGSVLPQLRDSIESDYIKYFLDVIYYSLSHELSAQIHQYYLYKKKHKTYNKLFEIRKLLNTFRIKKLNNKENEELNFIKDNLLKSILFYTKNKKYEKDIKKSIWCDKDNNSFLIRFNEIILKKIKWLDKKINLVDSKINSNITYETFSLPSNWDEHEIVDKLDCYNFIKTNLNDFEIIEFI